MDYQLVAVLIAGLAALLSYFSAREARKSSSSAAKVAEDIANKQHRTQLNDLKLQYHSEVREWAAETIKVMNELIVLCYIGEEPVNGHFKERQLELTYRISALLDVGRWFFPNSNNTALGQNNSPAFQGKRSKVLDCLFNCFELGNKISALDKERNIKLAKQIKRSRRAFTSQIQEYINSKEWKHLIEEIDKSAAEEAEKLNEAQQ